MTIARFASPARALRLAMAAGLALSASALGDPQGGTVVAGSGSISKNGNTTYITAANGTIINFQSFNVRANEVVQFIQPSAGSRVLNRVTGPDPSVIAGRIQANGIVYISNPAGVFFAHGSVTNVAGIYASAGNISNASFLSGQNNFKLTGVVTNAGTINAQSAVLVGKRVANFGAINAPNGMVTMAAGDGVMVGETSGQIYARVSTDAGHAQAGVGVLQAGQINAQGGQVVLGAGDLYAMAIDHPGRTSAREIRLQGGAADATHAGIVNVSGTLDASDRSAGGTGGSITLLGDKIGLFGATIDASGDAGGGAVRLGGDVRGSGTLPHASAVYVSEDASIRADAVNRGDGGSVVLWSNGFTNFQGQISAKGGSQGGNGGFVETSGKGQILAVGAVNASARLGRGGQWLLDPTDVTLSNSATSGGTLSGLGVFTPGSGNTANVNLGQIITALQAGTSVTINTTSSGSGSGDITLVDPFVASLPTLVTFTLNAERDINIGQNITIGGSGLNLAFNATRNISVTSSISSGGGSMTFTPGGATTLSADLNAGSGNIRFDTALLVGAAVNITGRNITFNGTTDKTGGTGSISLFGSGVTAFNAEVGGTTVLDSITTSSTGTTTLNTDRIRAGTMSFGNPITLAADVLLVARTSATFDATINSQAGAHKSLSINAPITTINADIGTALVDSDLGTLHFIDSPLGVDTTTLNTSTIKARIVTIDDPVIVKKDLTLTGSTSVAFNSTLDSESGTPHDLTINSPLTTFGANVGLVGADTFFKTLTTDNSGATDKTIVNASAIKAETINFQDEIELQQNLTLTGTSAVTLGDVNSGSGLGRDLTVNSPITTFNGTIGGATDGTLGTLTTDDFASVTDVTTINGPAIHAAVIDFGDGVVIGGNTTLTGATSVTFRSVIESAAGQFRELTINSPSTTFSDKIGAGTSDSALGLLRTDNQGSTDLTRVFTDTITAKVVDLQDAVDLHNNLTINAATSASLSGGVNSAGGSARDLTINSADATLIAVGTGAGGTLGTITTDAAGVSRFSGGVSAATLVLNDNAVLSDTITTAGDQTYNGAVQLAQNTTLVANNVTFQRTINSLTSDRALVINTSGNGVTRFNAAVGNLKPLASVTTNADGSTVLAGGQLTTSGAQVYNDAITLALATTINASGIAFTSTVDSADAVARDLSLNVTTNGSKTFGGLVGSIHDLGNLTTNSVGVTHISAASIKTTGTQTYNDTVLLGTDVTLTGGGLALLGGAKSEFAAHALTLNSINNGDTTLGGAIGGTSTSDQLVSITTNSDGRTIFKGGTLNTTFDQTYNDNILVGGDATITARSAFFNGTINSQTASKLAGLSVNSAAAGGKTFNGVVGGVNPLSFLKTDADGATHLNASVTTKGSMIFNDEVLVGADIVLIDRGVASSTNPNAGITFNNTLNSTGSARNITINVDPNASASVDNPRMAHVTFNGNVGNVLAFNRIRLGGDRTSVPAAATYAAGFDTSGNATSGFGIVINCARFIMGVGQKFTVGGNLTINATSEARLGDLSTLGSMNVNAPSIAINRRAAGTLLSVLPASGGGTFVTLVSDTGVDFVSGSTINFSSTPTLLGTGNAPQFATPDSNGIGSNLSGFSARSYGGINAAIFNSGLTILDLRSAGPSNTNIATTIAGAAPRPTPIDQLASSRQLGTEELQALADIGIETKGASKQQVLDLLMGRTFYLDASSGLVAGAQDSRITRNRLSPDAVDRVVAAYRAALIQETRDPATGQMVRTRRDAEIRSDLDASWKRYATAAGAKADALGFRAYLEAAPNEAQSLADIDAIRDLFMQIGTLGLTPSEVRSTKGFILRQITPASMTPEQLEGAITTQILGTLLAQAR
jgi:filamentous hemagglutinin family protein